MSKLLIQLTLLTLLITIAYANTHKSLRRDLDTVPKCQVTVSLTHIV